MIYTDDRLVRRNLDNIHSVDITELLLLCKSSTCHTCLLVILIEEILECDVGKSHALTLDLDMLFGLNSLMQSI